MTAVDKDTRPVAKATYQVLRKKLNRKQLLPYLAQVSSCKIAMESCGGSQWLAREIKNLGHHVQLIAPQHVKAYVTGNKNDFIDAEAICEAASRPRTRSVQVKTVEQQVLCTEHRLRKSLVSRRTAVINQVHGFLLEFGIIFPVGYLALDRVSGLMANSVPQRSNCMRRPLRRYTPPNAGGKLGAVRCRCHPWLAVPRQFLPFCSQRHRQPCLDVCGPASV